ncbi:MAG: TIGR01906 family membrane protein [Chloroflexi bacterium]|nr:TIGR01906 family membrane protein [Chloroflexota bacterium]
MSSDRSRSPGFAVPAALGWLAGGLWVLALPVFLMMLTGSLMVNQPRLYYYGFDHFDISQETGIAPEALRQVARDMITYFNDSETYFTPRVVIGGQERPLFTEREIVHMVDVKALVHKVYWVAGLSLVYLAGYAALHLALRRRRSEVRALLRLALYGGLLTLAILAVLGLWSLVGFGGLFYLFHILSFSNPFWQLDPRQHMLIRLFPEGFFMQATLFIAAATAFEALAIAVLSGRLVRGKRKA